MNEVKSLETELRSWVLRQPSAKVKPAIFGAQTPRAERAADERRAAWPIWSLLAPVAACLFVAVAALNQHQSLFPSGGDNYFSGTVASNQNYTVSSSNTFNWTNQAQIPSSVRSQLTPETNQ